MDEEDFDQVERNREYGFVGFIIGIVIGVALTIILITMCK